MITNDWSIQSDNYQRSMQWAPIFGVANLTTISATCNDHQWLVYPIWQLSAHHAMITNVWSIHSDNYQRNMQWSPIFGVANLITNVWSNHSDNNQRSMQWSPMFRVANQAAINTAACNDHQCLVYPIWQLSAQHAMITNIWSSQYGHYICPACNDHQYLV